ncbi:MAG: signal recognition particle-docking protein FtsY [Pseudomonadota bacterium]
MADEKKKGLFGRIFGGKKDQETPDRAPDETPSPTVADNLAPALRPSDDRVPHAATVEADSEAGDTRFLHDELDPEDRVPAPSPEIPSEGGREAEAPAASTEPTLEPEKPKKRGFFSRLTSGLSKTSQRLTTGVTEIFTKRKLDNDTLEELEDLLISADLGMDAAGRVVASLRKRKFGQEITDQEVRAVLAEEVAASLTPLEKPLTIHPGHAPHIILVIGVNGAGKTTTIGKLAAKLSAEGHSVLLAAGDTFRAAAIEQLAAWGERAGAPVLTKPHGADAAGLAFEAIEKARADGHDVLLIDTAGRLQNRSELMDELAKIVRVIKKLAPDAPHDTLLVLDATVGQNALRQAEVFTEIGGVTGLVMTKLDGTARGGVLVAVSDQFALPIHYIGIGESVDDLRAFNAGDFASALTTDA